MIAPWGAHTPVMPASTCDVTKRFAELGRVHPVPVVTAAVVQARHDLHCSPELALPELVEQLVGCRLTEAGRDRDAPAAPVDTVGGA